VVEFSRWSLVVGRWRMFLTTKTNDNRPFQGVKIEQLGISGSTSYRRKTTLLFR